jgi:outer membrane protein, heavy metal efflux system
MSRRGSIVGTFVLLTLSASRASAQPRTAAPVDEVAPPPPVTEEEIFRRWANRSQELASLRSLVRGARFDVVTAALWPNPSVQLNFMGTPAGVPPDGVTNYGVQVTQPLTVFGQVGARRDAAVAALSQTEVSVATALWTIASNLQSLMVARAYAHARVEVATRNLADVERIQEILQRRSAIGAGSQYDALRGAVAVSTLRAALDDAVVERNRAEARLTALIADPEVTAAPIEQSGLAAFRGPEDLRSLIALALRRRPDLELARRSVVASLAVARRWSSEARWSPSVWVGAYGTHQADSFSVTAGLSFPVPLFDRNQGLIARADNDAEGQRALTRALEVRIVREVEGAWNARADARRALERFRGLALSTSEEMLHRAEVTYRVGTTANSSFSIQDLFDAYRTVWDTRAVELSLQESFAEAEADLERAAALVVL